LIAYHGQQGGRLGFAGFFMAATGLIMIFGLNYFVPMFVVKTGAVIFAAGLIGLGKELWRSKAIGPETRYY
jgi:hypothetical protein